MDAKQNSILRSVILHLLPEAVGIIVYILITPIFMESGYPPLFSILIVAAVVLLPIEMGYLLAQARQINGRFSLKGIVLYRKLLPKWQYVVIPLALVIWGFLATGITPQLDTAIMKAWFSWLPEWYAIFDIKQLQG